MSEETPVRDVDLLNAVADLIEQRPGRYSQTTWGRGKPQPVTFKTQGQTVEVECGSVGCVAGLACSVGGLYPATFVGCEGNLTADWSTVFEAPAHFQVSWDVPVSLDTDVSENARKLLGLTRYEANRLFDGDFMFEKAGDIVRKGHYDGSWWSTIQNKLVVQTLRRLADDENIDVIIATAADYFKEHNS